MAFMITFVRLCQPSTNFLKRKSIEMAHFCAKTSFVFVPFEHWYDVNQLQKKEDVKAGKCNWKRAQYASCICHRFDGNLSIFQLCFIPYFLCWWSCKKQKFWDSRCIEYIWWCRQHIYYYRSAFTRTKALRASLLFCFVLPLLPSLPSSFWIWWNIWLWPSIII